MMHLEVQHHMPPETRSDTTGKHLEGSDRSPGINSACQLVVAHAVQSWYGAAAAIRGTKPMQQGGCAGKLQSIILCAACVLAMATRDHQSCCRFGILWLSQGGRSAHGRTAGAGWYGSCHPPTLYLCMCTCAQESLPVCLLTYASATW